MSPTLVNRMSPVVFQAARKSYSTTTSSTMGSAKWRWSNLSPKTRQYVLVGLTVGACVDTYVFYKYWPRIFGSKRDGE
ncbi:hypothetical protein FZEAL_4156 [Fusarium zealandicum]|uniref:Uncharacterized protein n=1 Tax=Fusarium zealandicum TaxID=1053134 RepID=A0A8H4UN22_9HYPO|nr:hypothetical protein FZEAL_4156 [Fusarium zealandicum]